MANVLRLSLQTLHSSSSTTSSFPLLLSNSTKLGGLSSRQLVDTRTCSTATAAFPLVFSHHKRLVSSKLHAAVSETEGPQWWERNPGPNMIDIHSTQEFLSVLSQAGEELVIVEFYGTWCGSCRALFPKLCKTAQQHPEILFLKVNFDENKPMCKSLNVKVLPFFHFYRGADGQLESFSCSLAKFQKIKDAIATHNTDRCSIGPPKGVEDCFDPSHGPLVHDKDLNILESSPVQKDKTAETSSR